MYEEICRPSFKWKQYVTFEVRQAGISYCTGSYEISRSNSSISVIEYIRKGEGVVVQNGIKHIAKAGDVYIIHPGTTHYYASSKDRPWIKIWFNMYGTLPETLYKLYGFENSTVVPAGENTEVLFDKFLAFMRNSISPSDLSYQGSIYFHQILLSLLHTPKEEDILTQIATHICSNAQKQFSVNEICERFNISRSSLFDKFKQRYHMTPGQYYIKVRVQSGIDLLENTNMTIRDIAEFLNFNDQHYFSKWFSHNTGINPSEYRKSKQKNIKKIIMNTDDTTNS